MKRHCLLVALAIAPFVAGALDLTPTASVRELEGFEIPILLFTESGKKISFQPPNNWKVSGTGTTLSFYPAELTDAVMQLRVLPIKPLAAGSAEDFEVWSRSQLPQDASQPKLESESANVFTLGPLPSREFTYSYAAQGRRFTTSVAFVEWTARERLAVVVTARSADFAATHEAAMRSMFSWMPL